MNVFTCTTRIYRDAEQRFTQGGDSIVSFKGPVESGFGQNKVTSWMKFNIWGKRGESLFPYLKDKTQVVVNGEIANREYTDKDGQKRYSLEVRVNDLTLVGGKQNDAPQDTGSKKQTMDEFEETIPF